MCAALKRYDTDHQIIFASVATIANRLEEMGEFDHIFIDEADEIPEKEKSRYSRVIRHFNTTVGGCTATPYWLKDVIYKNGSPNDKNKWFDKKVFEYSFVDAVNDGHLTTPVVASKKGIDSSKLKTLNGEYSIESQEAQALDESLARSIMREIHACAIAQQSNLIGIFACSIAHAKLLDKYCTFERLVITGDTSSEMKRLRKKAVSWGKKNHSRTKAIINVGVFTRGTNMPSMDYIALCRSMQSKKLCEQIIGRGARLWDGKDVFHISDFGDNFVRFGPIEQWGQGLIPSAKKIQYFHCGGCDQLNSVFARKCSNCGKKFQPEPFKSCPLCREDTAPATKKCTCGYVYADLKTYAFNGEIIKQKSEKIEKCISAISANHTITFYIKTKKNHFTYKAKWLRNKPTKDTVEFLQALYSIDYSDTKSVHEFLRQKRKDNPKRANRLIGSMGKIKAIWNE